MNISDDRKQRIYSWLEQPQEERTPQTELRKELHISYPRFAQIQQDWKAMKEREGKEDENTAQVRAIMNATLGDGAKIAKLAKSIKTDKEVVDEIFDQPEEMRKQTILALFNKAKTGDHNASFRLAQIMGWIIEKSEHKVEVISADDIAQRNLRAERELREGGYRVVEVQEKPPVLLK